MTPARKLALIGEQFALARQLHEAGVRLRNPAASPRDVLDSWGAMLLGAGLWASSRGDFPMEDMAPAEVLRLVARAFDALGVAYAIGGSWASSLYGEARMTRDANLAVEPFPGRERDLADQFGPEFYLSTAAAAEANRLRSTFNIIHTPTAFKVDVFVLKDDLYERTVISRRRAQATGETSEPPLQWVSPEDVILLKLRWFRAGGEVSSQQWVDVQGVLRTQAGRLDLVYLRQWAGAVGVDDLLTRALDEAGPSFA
jgi:hypothetical protein